MIHGMQIKTKLFSVTILGTFFCFSSITFGQSALRLIKNPANNDGVSVFKSNVETASSLEAKGMIKIDAPLNLVFSIIADHRHFTEWMPNVVQAKLEKKADGFVMTNTIQHALLMDDREVATWTTVACEPLAKGTTGGPQQIRIKFTAKDSRIPAFIDRPKKRALIHGLIRVPEMEGYWIISPGNTPNETRVTLQSKMDLSGSLTDSMKETAIEELASKTLKKLRWQVAQYQKNNIQVDYSLLKQNVPQVFQPGCIEQK